MKTNVEDKLKDKIEQEDKDKVLEAVKEALEWMEENSDAGEIRHIASQSCIPLFVPFLSSAQ